MVIPNKRRRTWHRGNWCGNPLGRPRIFAMPALQLAAVAMLHCARCALACEEIRGRRDLDVFRDRFLSPRRVRTVNLRRQRAVLCLLSYRTLLFEKSSVETSRSNWSEHSELTRFARLRAAFASRIRLSALRASVEPRSPDWKSALYPLSYVRKTFPGITRKW